MEKLSQLRSEMKKHKVDAYIQPVHDEYMSEYPPACNRRVEWLCGFTGSAGTAVVLAKKAALFTDGRYTLQAANQLDSKAYAFYNIADVTVHGWLADELPEKSRVGYDAKLFTQAMLNRLKSAFAKKHIALVAVPNLVDAIWADKPPAPTTNVFVYEQKYSGVTAQEKCNAVAVQLKKQGADAVVLSDPSNVNWLLNIRARDVENTPLLLAPAIVDAQGAVQLFVRANRIDAKVAQHFGNHVEICEPETLQANLQALAGKKIMVDAQGLPVWFTTILLKSDAELIDAADPCTLPKATKNSTELAGIRRAHIRDGAAIVKLLCWLESKENIAELEVVEKLLSFRKENELFVEPSFDTISGSGANGAIVHYRATDASNRQLKKGELFLLDSGGQYFDGTTDITRTVAIGAPSAQHIDRFTRVLKGHIAIATAQFPEGTGGSQLDALARQYLWQVGLDYDHGTGHGVGCFLGVHEGPQRISKRGGDAPLVAGMVVSNEPGYYKTGEYGIRIENLVEVVEKPIGENRNFFGFSTLTCAPIATKLIDVSLLTAAEKAWLNSYHEWVFKELSPQLDAIEKAWLQESCKPI